jgi:beta-lactamase class A
MRYARVQQKQSYNWSLIFGCIAVVLLSGFVWLKFIHPTTAQPQNSETPAVAVTTEDDQDEEAARQKAAEEAHKRMEAEANAAANATMGAAIQAVIAANPDVDTSVSVIDLKTGEKLHYGTNVVFETASVAKLLTATFYLHQVEAGKFSLNQKISGQPASQLIKAMIEKSDNNAWHTLNNTLGRPALQAYATGLSMTNYTNQGNTATSDDIALLVTKLYKGTLLNQTHTSLLLGHMAIANRTDYIKAVVPAGAKFYHKAGWLEDRAHDAAIIDNGSHPYVLVIFTNGHAQAHKLNRALYIQKLAQPTIQRFLNQ